LQQIAEVEMGFILLTDLLLEAVTNTYLSHVFRRRRHPINSHSWSQRSVNVHSTTRTRKTRS